MSDVQLPDGWIVVHTDNDKTVLEKIIAGKAVNAVGRDLGHAVEDALALDQRLDAYPDHVRSSHGNVVAAKAPPDESHPGHEYTQPVDEAADTDYLDLTPGRDA